jgi:hypothetical protein
MKIHLDSPLQAQGITIVPGDYEVHVEEADGLLLLVGETASIKLKPIKRSSKMAVRNPSVQMRQVANEPRYLLVVRTPPATEWVVSLEPIKP